MEDSIGKRIKAIRQDKNMTQTQLANKIFISESYMALIEMDKRNPSTDIIIKLADALNISSDYLLFGDITKNNMTLFNEWKSLTDGRTAEEITSAHNLVKCFFNNLDQLKEHK